MVGGQGYSTEEISLCSHPEINESVLNSDPGG